MIFRVEGEKRGGTGDSEIDLRQKPLCISDKKVLTHPGERLRFAIEFVRLDKLQRHLSGEKLLALPASE
ncbi:MAG: hypothetical protein R3222_10555 [Balneolaceae bacterium]|nr:hypothetical protein [Balneolaceae bacterium]